VLEHQYWDLNAYETEFEVTLKFGGIPKYLKVPYHAITRFHDPSVGFALQFDPPQEMEETEPVAQIAPVKTEKPTTSLGAPAKKSVGKPVEKNEKPKDDKSKEDSGEKVVSLDSFRKK